jgi:DHA1 family bicyclomycin/chloramphenicol resistance-like MFS transporter
VAKERVPLRLLLILAGSSAFGPLSMDAYLPALPALGRGLDASPTAVAATLTTCVIGLSVGQLVLGPVSDSLGRRRPLLAGLAVYTAASVACALAPTIWFLIVFRLVQGLAGAAGIVTARAIARDLYSGVALARFMGLMLAVMGAAPILAPLVGAALLHVTSWRGIFVALAALIAVLFFAALLWLQESLPEELRHPPGLGPTFRAFAHLLSDRSFVGYNLAGALPFGALFAYVSASPYVFEEIHGVSPQLFSVIFSVNALGIVLASRLSAHLVHRFGPRTLLAAGLVACAVGGLEVLAVVLLDGGLAWLLPGFFLTIASFGLLAPNSMALALAEHPRSAGSASALLGATQFVVGAAVAPLVGIAGGSSAVPMALVMAACACGGLLPFLLLTRRPTAQPDTIAA